MIIAHKSIIADKNKRIKCQNCGLDVTNHKSKSRAREEYGNWRREGEYTTRIGRRFFSCPCCNCDVVLETWKELV